MLIIEIILIITILLFVLLILYFQNNNMKISSYHIKTNKLNENIRIVHLSDLHYKKYGKGNIKLLDKIISLEPDIIIITGDIIDRKKPYSRSYTAFLKKLTERYRVYFVYGNQEMTVKGTDYTKSMVEKDLSDSGIIVIENRVEEVCIKDQKLLILGLNDYIYDTKNVNTQDFSSTKSLLSTFEKHKDYKILLNHFPQFFDCYYDKLKYSDYDIDLFLSGHTHGGQIRLPFIGGLYAPGQGLFPKYSGGPYKKNNVLMIVNRGLGNSRIPVRINNCPEIVVINLDK